MPPIRELLVLHHTHTDIGYTHPQPMLWELQRRFIDQAIDLAEQAADWPTDSQFRWTCETTAPVLHWLRHATSRQVDRFRAQAAAGRLGVAGLAWHPAPLGTADQLADLLQPVRELRDALGVPLRTAIGHDINGLPWPVTQLFADAGIELLIMGINICFGGAPLHRPLAFRWQGADGRSVLAFNGEHYAAFDREAHVYALSTDRMAEGLNHYLSTRLPADYPFDWVYLTATHTYFADNNPPDPALAELVRRWNDEGRSPRIRFILPEELLARLQAAPPAALPTHTGDWTDYWNFGAGSAATELRIARATRERLHTAELLASVHGPARPDAAERLAAARAQLNLWDEHTWGAAASGSLPDRDQVAEQWHHKAQPAYLARSLVSTALRDQLEHLAGNPPVGVSAQGVLAVNPAPLAQRTVLRVPKAWLAASLEAPAAGGATEEGRASGSLRAHWQHFSSNTLRLDDTLERTSDLVVVGPVELPGCGYRVLPVAGLPLATPPADLVAGPGTLESAAYRLDFDPASGQVRHLHDKRLGWDLLAPDAAWPFFGHVHECVDPARTDLAARYLGREALHEFNWDKLHANQSCWHPDWPALRRGPTRLVSLRTAVEPDGVSLHRTFESPGLLRLEQQTKLLAYRPAIELTCWLHKADTRTPEADYLAFAFDLPGWRAHYDTANLPVEFDAEQVPGVCRDWLTLTRWVCLHNDRGAVTLACPDAPLVQLGAFNFGRMQPAVPDRRHAVLLAWPTNNYWMTNFRASQPGVVRVRYELSTQAAYDPVASARAAALAAAPIEVHPVLDAPRPLERRLAELSGDGAILLNLGPAPRGKALLARVANLTAQPLTTTLRLPERRIKAAHLADTFGEPHSPLLTGPGGVQVDLPARAVRTLRLELAAPRRARR